MEYLKQINIKNIHPLNGFHNEMYKGVFNNDKIVIRKAKKSRRTVTEVDSEIGFLNDISDLNFVIKPYAINDMYTMEIGDIIYSFYHFVEGKAWHELTHTDDIIWRAGSNLAMIHQYSASTNKTYNRCHYNQHPDLRLYLDYYKDQPKFITMCEETLEKIKKLPKNQYTYGLIHGDYLYSNLIYNDQLTVIDFDDIEYGYYLYDIAVYVFYYLLGGDPSNMDIKGNKKRFKIFLEGYNSIRKLELHSLNDLNLFFRLRQMKLLGTIQIYLKGKLGPWQEKYILLSEEMIKNNQPFISQ
jgi:Ser/Thr protein kinase RdoA (MazF antagonist)